MPLVRISLQKGRTPAQLREIADTIHQALVDTYNVPPDDRFQIIEQREPAEIIYDAHFIAHSPRGFRPMSASGPKTCRWCCRRTTGMTGRLETALRHM
jgi:phenylpyruvate tautomerase PptA (4-oxalocrotonate tautomerase family)